MQEIFNYYFKKNKEWYFYDLRDGYLKLNSQAPKTAQKSYDGYLKDQENYKKVMHGLISVSDYNDYIQRRLQEEKSLIEKGNLFENEAEEQDALKLFGV